MPAVTGRVVRIKKLSKSQGQTILREDQIEDYDSLQSQSSYDTGVEKNEEKVKAPLLLSL